jgi:hypothetical protein
MNVARKQKSRVAATVFTAVAAHQVIHFDVRFKNRRGLSSPAITIRLEPYDLLKYALLILSLWIAYFVLRFPNKIRFYRPP